MGGAGYSIVGQNIYLAGTWNNALGSTVHYRYDIVADSWTQMADVPVAIYRPASGSIGTNTYLVGGGNPDLSSSVKGQARKLASTRAPATSYNSTYIYDTLSNTWSSGPTTNVPHSFTGGTAIGNKLIVVAGFDGVSGDTNIVETASEGMSCTIQGGIDTNDPTQTDRLFRSSIPQTCPASTACATIGDGLPRHYDDTPSPIQPVRLNA